MIKTGEVISLYQFTGHTLFSDVTAGGSLSSIQISLWLLW